MQVLVTGGAGFIGSALARRLLTAGHRVIIVDDLSTGLRENIPAGALFLERDLTQPDALQAVPPGPVDAVCHLAAQSSGAVSEEDPLRDFNVNVLATLFLIRWCRTRKVSRFLYASSMAVYGDGTGDRVVTEEAACVPKSHYGVSKLTSEHLLRLASREGLNCTTFRLFSVYGPGQNLGNLKQGMVSIYLAYLLRGVPVPVTGSLDRVRDFVYIDDVVDAWERALGQSGTASPIYNLGRGVAVTVRELLERLRSALDLPADYPVIEQPGSAADQQGIVADTRRLRDELGWRPRTELALGLKHMVEWAKAHVQVAS
jgi:UDP-glucose 4-epimerase